MSLYLLVSQSLASLTVKLYPVTLRPRIQLKCTNAPKRSSCLYALVLAWDWDNGYMGAFAGFKSIFN